MKVLLGTYAFIWWDSDPTKLSPTGPRSVSGSSEPGAPQCGKRLGNANQAPTGQTASTSPLGRSGGRAAADQRYPVLPVALGRVLALQDLPTHHKNPFDRLLIAQANAEEAVLISHDPVFVHYRVKVLW
jgi:PIN domain nuclease of toxin-antitoxin system